MSFPVSIESNKYERNALIFNLGFVFSLEDDDLRSYEPVVRKLAKVFRTLEVRSTRAVGVQLQRRRADEIKARLCHWLPTVRWSASF